MKQAKEITKDVLNNALSAATKKAERENKALGLDSVFVKNNVLFKTHPDGSTSKVRVLEGAKRTVLKHPITFK